MLFYASQKKKKEVERGETRKVSYFKKGKLFSRRPPLAPLLPPLTRHTCYHSSFSRLDPLAYNCSLKHIILIDSQINNGFLTLVLWALFAICRVIKEIGGLAMVRLDGVYVLTCLAATLNTVFASSFTRCCYWCSLLFQTLEAVLGSAFTLLLLLRGKFRTLAFWKDKLFSTTLYSVTVEVLEFFPSCLGCLKTWAEKRHLSRAINSLSAQKCWTNSPITS